MRFAGRRISLVSVKVRLATVLGTAALLGAAAYFWHETVSNPSEVSPKAVPTVNSRANHGTDAPLGDTTATALPMHGRRLQGLEGVTRLSQLVQQARDEPARRGQALIDLSTALAFCQGVAFNRQHPSRAEIAGSSSPAQKASLAFTRQYAKSFCDDTGVDPIEISRQFMSLDDTDEVLQARHLITLEGEEAESIGTPLAERLLLEATAPDAMEQAAIFLLDKTGELPIVSKLSSRDFTGAGLDENLLTRSYCLRARDCLGIEDGAIRRQVGIQFHRGASVCPPIAARYSGEADTLS